MNMEEAEQPFRELDPEIVDEEDEGGVSKSVRGEAKEHKQQLERLKLKDPEFYDFLREGDKDVLAFDDDDDDDDDDDSEYEDLETDVEDSELEADEQGTGRPISKEEEKPSRNVITTAMVDSWRHSAQVDGKIGAARSLLKAFRLACHYGDDTGDDSATKFSIISSAVFNKIMLVVLSDMDGIIRKLLGLPQSGGKKETINDLMNTRKWKNYNHLVKSYLGNALHVLNQMTDADMISFTLRRLKYSSLLLAAFPSLLRKYIKVVLHFWGTGEGALPVVSFLFLRDLCIRLGSNCLDECFKGIYKAYVMNCQNVNAAKLQHIQLLRNCVTELLGVDLPAAYQHAFVFIRQLAMILQDTLAKKPPVGKKSSATKKTKELYRKVYEWKFIGCLELWTGAICAYGSDADFRPLAYPLTQIISGVARLVPTARYFPLRLRCVRMLNRIAAATGMFIPVSMLLLDMLEMKELNRPPTGGVGEAVDLNAILKVSKSTVKTRAFQEACVYSVVEELADHLAQWSYSVAFFELSFIPGVRLRNFCKTTKVKRFQKELRQLIRQIDANSKFTNERRMTSTFLPSDPAAASFLEDEKKSGASPLSRYVATLQQRAQQRNDSLKESSVLVGEQSAIFGREIPESDEDDDDARNDKGATVFSSSWLPGQNKGKPTVGAKNRKKKVKQHVNVAMDEDVVEDLVLSSDEDGLGDQSADDEEDNSKSATHKLEGKKQKLAKSSSKKKSFAKKAKVMKSSADHFPSDGKVDNAKAFPSENRKREAEPTPILSKNVQSLAKKSKKRKRNS
ncbi:hypothetical protein Tsubulata_024531 [Turnera subulata]|uniref:Nucleolar complex protein 2 homolog n=1 Tax=Turnera subulata TaxID=218843 RepID=A0A9Q0FRP5_9ROSI|nr:hypothetical protein Tsubulata_024531 [Turnera subulata]